MHYAMGFFKIQKERFHIKIKLKAYGIMPTAK